MLTSIAMILLLGLGAGWLFARVKLPRLMGMILLGVVIGPHALGLVDESILMISGDIRQIALVIILTRAGLSLDLADLKKVGRPAMLMCFVPACVEMLGTVLFAPLLLGISLMDAAVLLVVLAMGFRMAGVWLSLLGTNLNRGERLFCMMAYTPKATVQAAIGTIPLSMGLACGSIVLTVAVISILFTAPLGALCVDHFYQKLLSRQEQA